MLKEKLEDVRREALAAVQKAEDTQNLYESVKVQFLGKQGRFSALMKEMGKLSPEERPQFGKLVNEVKDAIEQAYAAREGQLKTNELSIKLSNESIDLTLPAPFVPLG